MFITSRQCLEINVPRIRGGKRVIETVYLKPGRHNYNIDYRDPIVAEQLRIMRKHGRIEFDEQLMSDVVATPTPVIDEPAKKEVADVIASSGPTTDAGFSAVSEPGYGYGKGGRRVSRKGEDESR